MRIKTKHDSFTQEQLPSRLARVRTVHSAQQHTADEVVFVPSSKPFSFSLAYVALAHHVLLVVTRQARGPPFLRP